jgi:hypothetical protein
MRSFLLGRLEPLRDGASLNWRGVVYELAKRTLLFVAFVISIYAASLILKPPIGVQRGLTSIFVIAVFIQGALWADQLWPSPVSA